MMWRVRAVLLVVCLALAAAGCSLAAPGGGKQPRVTILGPWTDDQEKQFKAVLDTLDTPYTYQGTAATREVLLAAVQAGNPPDIAILPGVGDFVEYAAEGRLRPLGKGAGKYGRPWQPEAKGIAAGLWVPLKADLKSIIWYRKDRPPPSYPAPPASWCIGMGDDGASGWPGSDWIEDLILQTAGPVLYERWATGDLSWTDIRVARAWRLWAGLLAQDPDAARRALLADHRGRPGKHGLLFDAGSGCYLEHQGSFVRFFYGDHSGRAAFTDSAPLLPSGPRLKGREVSADFAALFVDSVPARDLLARLTSRPAQEKWGRRAGVFSPDLDVPARKGAVEKQISSRLTDQRVPLCLDASDVMPAAVRDAFYEAVLLTIAHPGATVEERLNDVQRVQEAQPDHTGRLTGVCSRPQ